LPRHCASVANCSRAKVLPHSLLLQWCHWCCGSLAPAIICAWCLCATNVHSPPCSSGLLKDLQPSCMHACRQRKELCQDGGFTTTSCGLRMIIWWPPICGEGTVCCAAVWLQSGQHETLFQQPAASIHRLGVDELPCGTECEERCRATTLYCISACALYASFLGGLRLCLMHVSCALTVCTVLPNVL
jgi:hypothetical protein